MTRLLIALALVVVVVLGARRLDRGRPDPPPRDVYPVPAQLDRDDFPRPEAPWLVVLFSSRTCDSCAVMALRVAELESPTVAVCEAEATDHKDLHARYRIEGVPMVVVADAEGVVVKGFVGAARSDELVAALGGEPD